MASTRLTIAIIQPEDASGLLAALAAAGCGATYLTARSGFLNRHAVAVLVLTDTDREQDVVRAIRASCSRRTALVTPVAEAEFGYVPDPIEVEIGGAVVMSLPAASIAYWGQQRPATASRHAPTSGSTAVPGAIVTPLEPAKETPLMIDTSPAKLVVAIVPDRVASKVVAALIERRFGATSVGSTGGFLRRGNTTILTGVPAAQADEAAALIEATCQSAAEGEAHEGGVVFALDVEWRLRV
jgi:uncharacterized protein YaaQ